MSKPSRVALGGFLSLALAVLALLAPVARLLAGKPEPHGPSPGLEATLLDQEAPRLLRLAPPAAVAPPAEFAPFGRSIEPRILPGDEARGRLLTNLGHADWDSAKDDLAASMPAALRLGPSEITAGPHGTLRPGLDY